MEEEKKQQEIAEAQVETPAVELLQDPQQEGSDDLTAENTLKGIATFVLIVGIMATVICLFTIVFIQNPEYTYHKDIIFSASGFATTIEVLVGTLAGWSLLRVIANISVSLKEISKKIK